MTSDIRVWIPSSPTACAGEDELARREKELDEDRAREFIGMFCRAAGKETGDSWKLDEFADGFAVVQEFACTETVSYEEKLMQITGCVYKGPCATLEKLAAALVPADRLDERWPLPWLGGCSSVDEMMIRLSVHG